MIRVQGQEAFRSLILGPSQELYEGSHTLIFGLKVVDHFIMQIIIDEGGHIQGALY
jgi:hypothetical protein